MQLSLRVTMKLQSKDNDKMSIFELFRQGFLWEVQLLSIESFDMEYFLEWKHNWSDKLQKPNPVRTCSGQGRFRVDERFVYPWNQTSHIKDLSHDASDSTCLTVLPLKAYMSPTVMISSVPLPPVNSCYCPETLPQKCGPRPFSEQMKTDTLNLISQDFF